MENPLKPGFGARLRAERKRLGYTQVDFSEFAGVKRVTQYLYEREDNSPNLRYLNEIANLGVDIFFVLFDLRHGEENINHHPNLLSDIFIVVDKFARDEKGKPLPLDVRIEFFNKLCETYSGGQERSIDMGAVVNMFKKVV